MYASEPERMGSKEQKVAEADAQHRAFANTCCLRHTLESEARFGEQRACSPQKRVRSVSGRI